MYTAAVSGAASGPIPERLGRYQVIRRLGAGGMAEVFLAKSTGAEGIEKILVVKRVLPTFARSAKFIAMFLEEAKIATRLNHPNIVQVYAFEQVKDEFLLAMEFVDGLDLGRLVAAARRQGSRIPYAIAAYATMEVARGLDCAHKRKDERGEPMEIVHRDVSPQNVLLSHEGIVKIADFGIAKARMVSEDTGVIKGKFGYMSPEQARGDRVDQRSDVYSLGVLLAELLMNRPMYPGQHGLDVLEKVRSGQVTQPADVDPAVPKGLAEIVRKALAFDREDRYETARQLSSAVGTWLHGCDEMVDGETLERFIGEMVPREATSPDAGAAPEPSGRTDATIASAVANAEREHRERRHVVVVAGRVRAGSRPSMLGEEAARVLADIAYKSDAVLSWPDGAGRDHFRFILCLRRASVHDPLASMTLGLDVVDALQGLSVDLIDPLSASLGVSRGVGSTVRDQRGRLIRYEPVGAVLAVAERLSEEGAPGEILVAGEVYRLVRRVFSFDEDAGEVEVDTQGSGTGTRGLRTHRLRGARTREERAADARSIGAGAGLIGRDEELRAFAEAYGEAVDQRHSVYLALTGDLGVGKTALISAAIDSLDPKPRLLHAECAFGSIDVPFATTADVVREALGIDDDLGRDEACAAIDTWAGAAIADDEQREAVTTGLELLLVPGVDDGADPAERPGQIRRACRILLGALAAQKPLLMWIDALQWADRPSLELFASLATSNDGVPLLAAFSTRPDPRTEVVLAGLPHIEVGELPDAERRRLITSRFDGAQVPGDVAQAIVERAGGNPFFVVELVEALVDRGVVTITGEGKDRRVVRKPGVPIALPTTLEGVIAARLDELPDAERRAIRWRAAAGAGMGPAALQKTTGTDFSDALNALEARGFVSRAHGDTYRFPSAVVRHVAYETTDDADREAMHQQIGAWLSVQRVAAPPARVARHLERAGDLAAAADAYLQAAARARAVYSNREALRFFARALTLLPPKAPGRFYAHEAREQILRGMGSHREQQLELEALRSSAKQNGDPAMVAMAMNRSARFELDNSRTLGVADYLENALSCAAEAEDKGGEVEALRLSAQLARETDNVPRALEFCDQALARCGLDRSLLAARGSVLVQKAEIVRRLGGVHAAIDANAEAIVIFRRLAIKRNESMALNGLGIALASLGEFEDASVVIRASIGIDREIGDSMHLGRKLSNVGQLNAELGEVELALEFLERADEVMEVIRDDGGRADALCAMAELVLETLEEPDRAAENLDRARRIAERTEDRYDQARERMVRASLEQVTGRLEQAEEAAGQAVSYAATAGIIVYQLLAQARLAEILALRGKVEEARRTITDVRGTIGARGPIERGERVHLALARALECLGDETDARLAYANAYKVVELRLSQIRSPQVRERYLETPVVRSIRGAL